MRGRSGLLVIGEVVTDVVARHSTPLAPATDTAARIRMLPGGAGANVAAWAARAGADVTLLARVGSDSNEWHREALLRAGVRTWLRVDRQCPTAVVIALVDSAAERTLVSDAGACILMGPGDWDDGLLDGTGHLHISGYTFFGERGRALAAVAVAAARVRRVTVSVDPASAGFIEFMGKDSFLEAVGSTDLFFPNLTEARLLTGEADGARAAEILSARHGLVAVKLGASGALLAERGRILGQVPAQVAEAVDSTGAGDAFTGGFLAAWLTGSDPLTAAGAGCLAGAEAVTVVGGRPPYDSRPGAFAPGLLF